ncbi:FIG00992965: hypothetical protein [hydrothermal vent metagenome]|uniref:Sulfotransferase domain-containing protein n=1 Tax=hydrothermal vent metagenome TaxID=652676 RepID=A0A3B0S9Y9_9ZZZZ
MDIILHLGAHRTATTSFQQYMYKNANENLTAGLVFWGPAQTRDQLFNGVIPGAKRKSFLHRVLDKKKFKNVRRRVAECLEQARNEGGTQIVISEENMIGNSRLNLRETRLYGSIHDRMTRCNRAFDGKITRAVLSVRSLDDYWSSVLAYGVGRGYYLPQAKNLEQLVSGGRHWREVITDLAAAMPKTEIIVYPFEDFNGRPDAQLAIMTGRKDVPRNHTRMWLNSAPELPQIRQVLADRGGHQNKMPHGEGRWQPFNKEQIAILRNAYAADLNWLRAGADGLAILIEDTRASEGGEHPRLSQ